MNYTDKEKTEFLETLVKEYYTQGDDYYAWESKKRRWHFGYDNDKPMQHGKGVNMILPNKMVEILMKRESKVKKLLISGVSVSEAELCDHIYFDNTQKPNECIYCKNKREPMLHN